MVTATEPEEQPQAPGPPSHQSQPRNPSEASRERSPQGQRASATKGGPVLKLSLVGKVPSDTPEALGSEFQGLGVTKGVSPSVKGKQDAQHPQLEPFRCPH